MKQLLSTFYLLMVLAATSSIFSCSKSDISKPVSSQQGANKGETENLIAATPEDIIGRHKITRFIEDGKNETFRFTGYRFEFQSDSDFVARTDSRQIVMGNWLLDTTGTVLTIDIDGTGSLDKLVGEWRITDSTGNRLALVNADADRVVFTRIIN